MRFCAWFYKMFEAHTINAQHKDLIHDVAYNYYGDRMATCSSDQFVKVSLLYVNTKNFPNSCISVITDMGSRWTWKLESFGNVESPQWLSVEGNLGASRIWSGYSYLFFRSNCLHLGRNKYDFFRNILVWLFSLLSKWFPFIVDTNILKESGGRQWVRRANLVDSRTSVTDVRFTPKNIGLFLSTCAADGILRIYESPDIMNLNQWSLQHEVSSKLSCSCLTWSSSFNRLATL